MELFILESITGKDDRKSRVFSLFLFVSIKYLPKEVISEQFYHRSTNIKFGNVIRKVLWGLVGYRGQY